MRMIDLIKAEEYCSHENMVREYSGRSGWSCCDCKRRYTDGDIEILRTLHRISVTVSIDSYMEAAVNG